MAPRRSPTRRRRSPIPGKARCSYGSTPPASSTRSFSWIPDLDTQAGEPRPFPVIPGHEFSGEIAALGAGVRDVGVGDLVYGLNDWYRDGASAEYCVARVADIAHKPAGVDHVHAAATPISALTVWQGWSSVPVSPRASGC